MANKSKNSVQEIRKGICPACGAKLSFAKGDRSVVCPFCDGAYAIRELERPNPREAGYEIAETSNCLEDAVKGIDSPESALLFMEDYFAKYDWTEWNKKDDLYLPIITDMLESVKIKYGKNPVAWELAFIGLAALVAKKIDGLQDAKDLLINNSDAYHQEAKYTLGCYSKVVKFLVDNRERYLEELRKYLDRAIALGLKPREIKRLEKSFAMVETEYQEVHYVDKVTDIEEYVITRGEQDEELVKKLTEQGIDVDEAYLEGLRVIRSNPNEALSLFEKVRGYKDVEDLIAKLDKQFTFGDLYYVGGKHVYINGGEIVDFEPEKNKKRNRRKAGEEAEYYGRVCTFYAVDDNGKIVKKPIIDNVSAIVSVYGNSIFYVKKGADLCVYDLAKGEEKILVDGDNNSFDNELCRKIYKTQKGSGFYIRKKLDVARKGGTKGKEIYNPNNYSVILVDMANKKASTVLDEVVDIYEYKDGKIFFGQVDDKEESTEQYWERVEFKILPDLKVVFKQYDIASGKITELLYDNCDIKEVFEGKVIYTVYTPNKLNNDLCVYDVAGKREYVLEKNICGYLTTVQGKVYFSVGNGNHAPIYSIDLNGKNRRMVGYSIERILKVTDSYIIAVKRINRNKVIVRISLESDEMVLLGDDILTVLKVGVNDLYYVDNEKSIRLSDLNGNCNKVIAKGVKADSIIVDQDAIYFVKYELVGLDGKTGSYSLYRTDLKGDNLKKLLFDVNAIKDFDQETIYVLKQGKMRFETVATSKEEKKEKKRPERFIFKNVKRYYAVSKESGASKLVLSLGDPADIKGRQKGGKTIGSYKYVEAPEVQEFKSDVAYSGKNFVEI